MINLNNYLYINGSNSMLITPDLYGDGLKEYIKTHGKLPQFWYDNQEFVCRLTK